MMPTLDENNKAKENIQSWTGLNFFEAGNNYEQMFCYEI